MSKQHGRDARIRKGDYHATVAEHRKFSHHDMKLLEEDTFTCPCCLETGCRVTTDGNRKTVCYNPPCKNCGRCERCLNPDSYYSLGASPSEDLYVAEAEADIKLEAMYPEKNKTQREEPQMCGDAEHKVLRNQSHVESKTKCVTGMVAAVCTHYFMLACVAMKVRAGLLVAAYIETTAMRHHQGILKNPIAMTMASILTQTHLLGLQGGGGLRPSSDQLFAGCQEARTVPRKKADALQVLNHRCRLQNGPLCRIEG